MIDLHLHLDGSLSPAEVLQLAALSQVALPCQDEDTLRPLLEVEPGCRNLGEYLEKFDLPLQVLQTEEALSLSVYFLLKRLASQGLCYGEIRFAPQLHLRRGLTQQQVTAAAVAGLEKAVAEFQLPAQLILCCMRGDENQEANLETVRVARDFLDKGVCAVDLAGNEAAYPTRDFAPVFSAARENGIPIIIHAGEAAGPESIREAIALGAKRIGHGIRAIEDPDLLTLLAQTRIPLELCYTSNLQTKAAADATSYPLPVFLSKGIAATVNTDNMTVSGTCLKAEYRLLQKQFGFSLSTMEAIACTAADAAFVTPDEADRLKAHIRQQFTHWIDA